MQNKYYVVIDTNVIVSALLGVLRMSNPTKVLKGVIEGKIVPLYNDEIISEYREVLLRKKFSFSEELVDSVLKAIVNDGLYLDRTTVIDELFSDPKDIVFYEVSLSKEFCNISNRYG